MLQWFNATEAVAFGKHMAQEVARIVPLEASQVKGKKEQKRLDQFRRAITHAGDLGSKTRLNVYKKARCANALRWGLIDKGYPKPFVEEVVRLVITRL
jgi:hypothetical protein